MSSPTNNESLCLVVIYNHNFEKNIPIVRSIYKQRFTHVIQLMPFYSGSDPDVVPVFGNSLQFHQFIAQARNRLKELNCDRYLFIGDDLLLNPIIDESSFADVFGVGRDECYISKYYDVSKAQSQRGTMEASKFEFPPFGLDRSALKRLPDYETAKQILMDNGLLESVKLTRFKRYQTPYLEPILSKPRANSKILLSRLKQRLDQLKYRIFPRTVSYPVVFAYSDIFSFPSSHLNSFCDYLEVFASVGMFVELAIPTAFALHPWKVKHEDSSNLKPMDIWFPPDPEQHEAKVAIIHKMEETSGRILSNLEKSFPSGYLYMHPVKLSTWR